MTQLTPSPLATLATQINHEHQQCVEAFKATLGHARNAGELLIAAKAQVRHGEWLPWLKENCPAISDRTARNYMRICREWDSLPSGMEGIKEALAALAPAKSETVANLPEYPWQDQETFAHKCMDSGYWETYTHLMLALRMEHEEIAALTGKSEDQVSRLANPSLPKRFFRFNPDSMRDITGLFVKDYDSATGKWMMLDNAEGYIQHYERSQAHDFYMDRQVRILSAMEIASENQYPEALSGLEYALHQTQSCLLSVKDWNGLPSPFEPFPVSPAWEVLLFVAAQKIDNALCKASFDCQRYVSLALLAMMQADLDYAKGIAPVNPLSINWSGEAIEDPLSWPSHFLFHTSMDIWINEQIESARAA